MSIAKKFLILILLVSGLSGKSQVFTPGGYYPEGVVVKENSVDRKFIPYTSLREGDVQFSKRVWRNIDLREKVNQVFYFPIEPTTNRISLIQLILKEVLAERVLAFEDDEFTTTKDIVKLKDKLVIRDDSAEVEQFDANGAPYMVKVAGKVDSTWIYENFVSIDIKEDWFFDKQKSVMESRIISIGFNALLKGKEDLGPQNQFWVYFPACRPIFAATEVYNGKNDSERRTYDDVFWKRQFNSNIVKESNVYDRDIQSYSKGIDALLENDRIKKDLFQYEHDLWHF